MAIHALLGVTTAAIFALIAIYTSRSPTVVQEKTFIRGRNNTILFLSNDDFGLANVLLATAYSLLTDYPDLEIHYGTHPKFQNPLGHINAATKEKALSKPITTHFFHGKNFGTSVTDKMKDPDDVYHRTGWWGLGGFLNTIAIAIQPVEPEQYLSTFHQCLALIEEVDPAIVVVEPLFAPGIDAIRHAKRKEVMLSPSALQDTIAQFQPNGEVLWKYPVMASGYTFPLPWYLRPVNTYITLRLALKVVTDPRARAVRKLMSENGVDDPFSAMKVYTKEQTFISIGDLDTELPFTIIPENVIPCGPIYLSSKPVSEQDPALATWLKRAPTILFMLGSHTMYREDHARAILKALRIVFDTTGHQVLWKFKKLSNYTDELFEIVEQELQSGRLRLEKWIPADPAAMMETGDIVLSVNHGGSNCYHEALANGVPQLLLPMWADCFDFAMRAEYRKIGIYGNRKAHPWVDGDELAVAFKRVLGDGEEARMIRESAKKLGEKKRKTPGRECAAREVARLARN